MNYIAVRTKEELNELKKLLSTAKVVAYDYETFQEHNSYENNLKEGDKKPTGFPPLDLFNTKIAGVGYSVDGESGFYVPINHKDSPNFPVFVIDELNEAVPEDAVFVAHNAKYELCVSKVNNIYLPADRLHDTLLLVKELSTEFRRYGLKDLSEKIFNFKYKEGDLAKKYSMEELMLDQVYEYACTDVIMTWKLWQYCLKNISKNSWYHYTHIEQPLIDTMVNLEMQGIKLDKDKIKHYREVLEAEVNKLEKKIYEVAEEEFNPSSAKQLSYILFDKFQMPVLEYTSKGAISTSKVVLQKLAKMGFELPQLILDYRKFSKMVQFFLQKLHLYENDVTGRIHPSYAISGAETGRFTCYNPNMQQMKKTGEELNGEKISIRGIFIPHNEDEAIVSLDFSGIELRVCAIVTRDETMLNAFKHDLDLHSITTQGIFGEDIINHPDFKKKFRQVGKRLNFGILYGGGAGLFSDVIGDGQFTVEECEGWIDKWYDTYPQVLEKKLEVENLALTQGFIETLFGKRRTFYGYNLSNSETRSGVMRRAFNHLIQGTAADMMKITLNRINAEMPDVKMLATIHDEVVFSIPKKELFETVKELHSIFTDWDFEIPIYSSISVGESFGDMEDFEKANGDGDIEGLKKYCEEKGWL